MKAYPLIYSRTKYADFVGDFLTRPNDFEWKASLKYINTAMQSLDITNDVRYSAFSIGDYCVCGAVSGLTKNILSKAKMVSSFIPDCTEYLRDVKGRNIAAFIGIAIHKKDIKNGMIPDVKLDRYWNIYLEYLKKQWDSPSTSSEKIFDAPLEIPEKSYSGTFVPAIEKYGNKTAVMGFESNQQEVLDYFFNEIMNNKSSTSFVSGIHARPEWDSMPFGFAHAKSNVLTSLKSPEPIKNKSISSSSKSKSGLDLSGFDAPPVPQETEKKTAYSAPSVPKLLAGVAAAVAVLIIIVLILSKK